MRRLLCYSTSLMLAGLTTQLPHSAPLCINGHPAPRDPNVTYGGLPEKSGYQRDHVWPLELGGPDTADNVKYQRCDQTGPRGRCEQGPAKLKDDDEHFAGGQMCAGRWSQDFAKRWLAGRWPVDAAHGYLIAIQAK